MVNVVLCDLDLHFQGQQFSFVAFVIKNALAADVPGRFASTCTVPDVELLLPFYIFMILSLLLYSFFCTFILFFAEIYFAKFTYSHHSCLSLCVYVCKCFTFCVNVFCRVAECTALKKLIPRLRRRY